ncbi:hypothetical protein S140_73 [Shewanella sp. phage 1/40]|uniref:hypothetical protein n=1 Tax=Shewanella sp. phage 1/40 TaxID=1458860 RepID=UPI0004F6473C|nr:hypothetical protein S140_73 [Shewanella sp. phage 1/40]AHK11483.1 hypothetical protein S140_73 [Shewanella sp. phage 1/40]
MEHILIGVAFGAVCIVLCVINIRNTRDKQPTMRTKPHWAKLNLSSSKIRKRVMKEIRRFK